MTRPLTILDLFSGIGGFSLGLERCGMRTIAFCEIDPYCRRVLAKHWPGVPIYEDVRALTAVRLAADGIGAAVAAEPEGDGCGARWAGRPDPGGSGQFVAERPLQIDLICGGFPCQDISVAGKGAGIDGARSGLWSEYARIIGEVRPRYVLIENVSAMLGRGLSRVLGDLAALGYDAEWHAIPACALGAPHRRDRLWIVADAIGAGLEGRARFGGYLAAQLAAVERNGADVPDPAGDLRRTFRDDGPKAFERSRTASGRRDWWQPESRMGDMADGLPSGMARSGLSQWAVEPDIPRVAQGIPDRVNKLRALGNAVVPQIPEMIGRAILAHEVAA